MRYYKIEIMNKLINNVIKVISEIIFEFFKPEYLRICISLFKIV